MWVCDRHASARSGTALVSFSSITRFRLYLSFPLGSGCLWMCLSLHVRHTPDPSSQVNGRNTHKHTVVHKQEPHVTQYLLSTLQWFNSSFNRTCQMSSSVSVWQFLGLKSQTSKYFQHQPKTPESKIILRNVQRHLNAAIKEFTEKCPVTRLQPHFLVWCCG